MCVCVCVGGGFHPFLTGSYKGELLYRFGTSYKEILRATRKDLKLLLGLDVFRFRI